ncbi:hypothetical protein QQG55_55110 [Brugia pahangi]
MKPASSKLYHMMPKVESLNNVLPSLSLYIIYRSDSGISLSNQTTKQHADYSKARSRLEMLNNLQVQWHHGFSHWMH